MKRSKATLALLLSLLTLVSVSALAQVSPVPQLMNFQGRLARPDGTPVANGNYNLQFSLYDALTNGTLWWQRSLVNVPLKNGTFAAHLDFSGGYQNGATQSSLFGARALYLEISLNGGTPLSPRQQFVTVAYAMKADSVQDGSITSASILDGTIANADLANNTVTSAKILDGTITGADIANATITADKFAANIFYPIVWLLGGNSGVTSGFLGTSDNQPLVFKANNRRAMRYEYAEDTALVGYEYRSMNVLGGSEINSIGAGVVGATIAGGGQDFFSGTDYPNAITADFGAIGGGGGHVVSGYAATVAGGAINTASAQDATAGGGRFNTASGQAATVAGGNSNTANNQYATVGGGFENTASGFRSTVAGGFANTASGERATVGGGFVNTASGDHATMGGGFENTASGRRATVPGGQFNTAAGAYSFAAGRRARANHDGAFVWADSTDADFASTVANQFNVRASGGTRIFSNGAATTGVLLAAGGGSWSTASDKSLKTNFQKVDSLDVLEKLIAMPLTTWNYKANTDIRHMGVMAQDFHAAFGGLGLDDKHIDTVDADGVAFAAIQGLNRKLEASNAELKKESAELKKDNDVKAKRLSAVEAKNAELEARLERLEAALKASSR